MPVAPGRVNAPPSPSSPSSPASLVFRNCFGSSAALPSGAAQRCRRREGREDAESEPAPVPMRGTLSQAERRRRQKLLASAKPDLCQTVLREGPDPPPPSAVVVSPATRRELKLPVETHGTLTVRQQACPCGCGATGRSIIVEGYAEGTILEVDDGHGLPPTRLVTQSGRLRVDDFREGAKRRRESQRSGSSMTGKRVHRYESSQQKLTRRREGENPAMGHRQRVTASTERKSGP